MNPASSLGPTLISGRLTDIWIYICAPLIGALAAVLIFNNTNNKEAVKVKAS